MLKNESVTHPFISVFLFWVGLGRGFGFVELPTRVRGLGELLNLIVGGKAHNIPLMRDGGHRLPPSVQHPVTAGCKRKPFAARNQCHYHVKRRKLVIKEEIETLISSRVDELPYSNRFRPVQHSRRHEKKREKLKRGKQLATEEDHREWAFSTSNLSRCKGSRF